MRCLASRRTGALLGLVLLAGCHRPSADQPAPGADGEAQARTGAKTLADIQAAEDASRGPPPVFPPIVHREAQGAAAVASNEAAAPETDAPDEAPANQDMPQQ